MSRSSRLEVCCRKGVLRNFAKFTGKHLCQSLFFNKLVYICEKYFYLENSQCTGKTLSRNCPAWTYRQRLVKIILRVYQLNAPRVFSDFFAQTWIKEKVFYPCRRCVKYGLGLRGQGEGSVECVQWLIQSIGSKHEWYTNQVNTSLDGIQKKNIYWKRIPLYSLWLFWCHRNC